MEGAISSSRITICLAIIGISLAKGNHFKIEKCDVTPHSLNAKFDIIHSAHCTLHCFRARSVEIWGSKWYTYDSSICKSALHDNRISAWNESQRTVSFIRKSVDPQRYYGSYNQGFRSSDYRHLHYGPNGHYYFSSPKVKEPLLDVTSLSRGFLRSGEDESVVQECHLGTNARSKALTFQYYLTHYEYHLLGKSFPRIPPSPPKTPEGMRAGSGFNEWVSAVWKTEPSGYFFPGGLWCKVNQSSYSHVLSLTMDKNADFYPDRWTVTVSVEDSAVLRMRRMNTKRGQQWRKDGGSFERFYRQPEESSSDPYYTLSFSEVTPGNRGLYSLEADDFKLRGIIRLVVRGCTADQYGPSCEFMCPRCQNGGVCHDIMGGCICPPGFNGTLCEHACGDNHYGNDCSLLCSDSNPRRERTCQGLLFCLPDPFGCSCGVGFKGLDCETPCAPGEYGLNCDQHRDCHCDRDDQSCDRATGLCPDGCLPGWKGDACHISYPYLSKPPKLLRNAGTRKLQIQLSPWDGAHGEGTPVYFVVEIKRNDSEQDSFQEVLRLNYTFAPQELSFSLEGLIPNTRYVVRAVLLDMDGQAQRDGAPFAVFRTACGKPERPPEHVEVNYDDPQAVRLSWKYPDPKTWNCDSVSVRVQYNTTETSRNTTLENREHWEFLSEPYLPWSIALRLETPNDRVGDWTEVLQGTSAQDAPEKVQDLRLKFNAETRQLVVTWKQPLVLNGILKYYVAELYHLKWLHPCEYSVPPVESVLNVTQESAIFEGVRYSSVYRVHVLGFTVKRGMYQYKDIATDEAGPLGPPQEVEVIQVKPRQLLVKWTQPFCQESNGRITGYVIWRQGLNLWDQSLANISTMLTSALISNLVPYTNYEFRVHACTRDNCGESYGAARVTTLSEAPLPPGNLTIYRTTMTSLSLSWKDPFPPYGIVTRYKIIYRVKRGNDKHELALPASDMICQEPGRTEFYCYTLNGLLAKRCYEIQLITVNVNGTSAAALVEGETDESVPDPPDKLNVSERTTSSLLLVWEVPYRQNGNITGYQVNVTRMYPGEEQEFVLSRTLTSNWLNITQLAPATMYSISVAASTSKGYGPNAVLDSSTRSPAFSIKELPRLGEILENAVVMIIKPIDLNFVPMSAYFILVKEIQATEDDKRKKRCAADDGSRRKRCTGNADDDDGNQDRLIVDYNTSRAENLGSYAAGKLLPENIPPEGTRFLVGDGKSYNGYYNAPLETGHSYKFGLAVVSEYAEDPKSCFLFSEDVVTVSRSPEASTSPPQGLVVGMIIICLLAVTAILLFLYYKKPQLFHSIKDKANSSFHTMINNKESGVLRQTESSTSLELYADVLPVYCNRIAVGDLEDFVKKADASGKIVEEFQSLLKAPSHPKEVALLPENKAKNRYGSLLPFDHNRVILEKWDNDPRSDYINASYMEGYKFPRKYIATQGPKPLTMVDFWRMVWQENICKIVMVTNILENGKVKCEKYWPETSERYGQFTIQLVDTNTYSDYVIRTFHLSQNEGTMRVVTQFHFSTWPDHSVPMYPLAMGGFLKRLRGHRADSGAPTVVHCSAGVGRTGTLILLDCMMDMALSEDAVDLPSQLWNLRQQRVNQIENADQYTFVYQTLSEVLCGVETSTLCSDFYAEFAKLEIPDPVTGKSLVQEHFERLDRVGQTLKAKDCQATHDPDNYSKNRDPEIVPPDRSRPVLPILLPGKACNYINAVYVNGYKQRDAFVTTQLPLPNTVQDFWRMIKSTRSRSIVLLQESELNQYWPEIGNLLVVESGLLTVEATSVEIQGDYVVRMFTIRGPTPKEEVTVKQFHLQSWSTYQELPSSPDAILNLIEKVERWQKQTGNRPITVQCLDGASACGVFCASVFVCDKIKAEQEVDVYLAVRSIRHNRPQFVKTLNQYLFCHRVALNFLDTFETYANFQ